MSEPRNKTISTPEGPVATTTTTVDPTPQQIKQASAEDVAVFAAYAEQAPEFVKTYVPAAAAPTLKDCDEAFRLWQLQAKSSYTRQHVVEILGAYLGARLISDFQMDWVVVTDEYGTDYAVRSKRYEVMAFPFSSVVKRIERNQYDFMVGVYYSVKSSLESGDYKERK